MTSSESSACEYIYEPFDSEDKYFKIRFIRRKERPQCIFSSQDEHLPLDDPLEVEYQMLRRKHASKLREYEENLRLEKLRNEELKSCRARLAQLQEYPQ